MRCLIIIAIICAAIATAMAYPAGGVPYYPPGGVYPGAVPGVPGVSSGGRHYGQGHSSGSSGGGGRGHHGQGSNMYYDQGHNHSRTKQIYENENSSGHNVGAGSQGSQSGGSGGRYNGYDNGYVDSGNGYSSYMPGYYK